MGEIYVSSDIGGTFTDTVVADASGAVERYKAATTPDDLVRGVLDTFELAARARDTDVAGLLPQVRLFSHGTTIATNALLQRRGARTGVIHTAGFGDTLYIMRAYKSFGLDEAALKRRAVRELVDAGVEAIAISLLWCFKHPEHEQRIKAIIAEEAPGLYVTASSDILARMNEYARTVTTSTNAFLGPQVKAATGSFGSTMRERGLTHSPLLMQSNGGVGSVDQAGEQAVNILLSGPVGGVGGSKFVADHLGEANVVTTDMGGTSFDVGLVVDGKPLLQATTILDGQPVAIPSVAVQTVGAGGGSIAKVTGGLLTVGPESAGAVPGPAYYGEGGEEPTVTDADVVLGLINPDNFLGGRIKLDRGLAEQAIRTKVAEPLGMSVEDAAEGIKRIVDSKMTDLIRQVTVHTGFDPREFVLVAFGGAGPVHAHASGAALGVKRIVVPVTASVHSAYGILASDLVVTRELSRSFFTPPGSEGAADYVSASELNAIFRELESEARAVLDAQGMEPAQIDVQRFVDMRFRFQIHELTVEVPASLFEAADVDKLLEQFIDSYEARFGEGSAFTAAGVEMVTWRVVATGGLQRPALQGNPGAGASGDPIRVQRVYDGGEWHDASVYDESALASGAGFTGPAILELPDTTIVVGREQRAAVDEHGNVIIEQA